MVMEGSHGRDHRDYDLDPVLHNDLQWKLIHYGNVFGIDDQQSGDCYFGGYGAKAPQIFEGN